MKNLFSDDNSGYRLKTLQILNWGVFDEKVKTFEFDNKSTILTGYNGSGKTTCVDAILTLLVPSNLRWYNLSSESVKKRERDVENYVLGAWGNTGDSGTKFLREKDTISIINGIFSDPVMERELSLLQVRYFVGDKLDTKYGITEKELRLEDANRIVKIKGFSISSDGKWRKILAEEKNTRFFESFTSYKTFFMDKFGFRSDNALKLFSQTVGMKVLGDMTTFVRTYMLEDKTPEKEFKDLDEEFMNLLTIDKNLRKAEKKLEKLDRVHESIGIWEKSKEEKDTAELNKTGEELWFLKNATEYGEKEIISKERRLKELEENTNYYSNEIERITENIQALSQDTSTSFIDNIEREISTLKDKLSETSKEYTKYKDLISKLNSDGASLSVPTDRDSFFSVYDSIPFLEKKIDDKKESFEEKINENNITLRDIEIKIKEYEGELEYLSNRETNIPKEYDELRQNICTSLSLPSFSLYYLGELIRIKEDSGDWKNPLLKTLNAHALDLLVKKEYEKEVSEYLDSKDIGLNVNVVIVEERLFENDNTTELQSLVEIKENNNPYKEWLLGEISHITDYSLTLNLKDFLEREKAILPSSLIKNEDKLIKYDEKESNGTIKNYIGWDNKKKRHELIQYIKGQEDERLYFENLLRQNRINRDKCNSVLNNLSRLKDYADWDVIDVKTIERVLKEKEDEKRDFLAKNKDIEEKRTQLEEEKRKKARLEEAKSKLLIDQGSISHSLNEDKLSIAKLNENLANIKWDDIAYSAFTYNYSRDITITSCSDIYSSHNKLSKIVDIERNQKKEAETINRITLEKEMDDFVNPSLRSVNSELNWSGEYSDFSTKAEDYEDYETEYLKIKDDDISVLKQKFNDYLTSSLVKNLGQLNEKIKSWDKEITQAIKTLNRNLTKIPFNKDSRSHIQLEIKNSGDKDHLEFNRMLEKAIPNARYTISDSDRINSEIYERIKIFLDKYRSDDMLRKKVLDIRRKYEFTAKEINGDGTVKQYYKDTGALSGGEKAKLTFTILAASIAYQFNLDDNSDSNKGPFRFVILDEAFSKSDAKNSIYALELFKELDLQLMVVTPRNGINIVEGYVSTLHLLEKDPDSNKTSLSSMTIKEYKEGESASIF